MNSSGKFTVCIFSDANFLAENIALSLLSKNCFVNIITKDVKKWKNFSPQLSINSSNIQRYDYTVFCGGFINKENVHNDYKKFLFTPGIHGVKILLIFPLEVFNISRVKPEENTAVIYIGDLVGKGINLESDLFISKTIKQIFLKKQISLGIGEYIYPIYLPDAVRLVIRWLFSFGPFGKETAIFGKRVSGEDFWRESQKIVGQIKPIYDANMEPRNISKNLNIEKVNSDLAIALFETYRTQEVSRPRISRQKIYYPEWFKPVVILLIILLFFPLIIILASFSVSLIGYKEFTNGYDEGSRNTFLFAKTLAMIAEKESKIWNFIPGVNSFYKEVTFTAGLVSGVNQMAYDAVPAIRNATGLVENVISDKVYDPQTQTSKISDSFSSIYLDLIFIQKFTKDAVKDKSVLAGKISSEIDFAKYINLALQGKILADNAPEMLGKGKSKTYLVLFQNNMELRPTGGFIGSYGLMTFDGGRLSDLTISDVYSADGQLNGHVEPPAPIKDYLGEANWYLRDSNWDPDFPTSAQRAEWFLTKEIGKSVDGVVAIDLTPIKDILKETGPIYLADYNLNISSNNLYEKTQSEVQDNSFPGTHQKASFLTALSRNLLGVFVKVSATNKMSILKTFYSALEARHLQIFLHNDNSQNAIASIGWDGSVTMPLCVTNCYSDTIGLVEANVGVNKANFFIQRSMNVKVNVGSYQIERNLILNLKNTASPSLGVAGKYKAYVRLLIPLNSNEIEVVESAGQNQTNVSADITEIKDRKEIGILVEILAGQNLNLTYSWKSKLTGVPISNYMLYVRKQAGVDELPVSISISGLSLTKGTPYLYNAILTRDLISRFSL